MMKPGVYTVITDGKVFRIKHTYFGAESFIGEPPLDFLTREMAEKYLHNYLSMSGWKEVTP